jgi:hypothetical protein
VRVLAMILFALALAKVGLIQHLRLQGARDVVVAAHGSDAIKACERADERLKLATTSPAALDLTVGNRVHTVNLWQVDHADWANRYRKVYLDVAGPDGGGLCRYDVVAGTTQLLFKTRP